VPAYQDCPEKGRLSGCSTRPVIQPTGFIVVCKMKTFSVVMQLLSSSCGCV